MRKFLTSFAAVVLALSFLSSCGDDTQANAKDIKVEDLKEPCDFSDAMLKALTEAAALKEEMAKNEGEDTKEQKASMKELEDIFKKMEKAFDGLKLKDEDIKECDSYKALEKLMK